MKWKGLVAGLAMSCFAPFALAQGDAGYYIAVDVGQTTFKDTCETLPGTGCRDNDLGSRFSLGYQFNRFISAEVGYFSPGKAALPGGSGYVFTAKEWHYTAILSVPLGKGYSVFGRGGAAIWDVTSSIRSTPGTAARETGVDVVWGGGFKYDISSSMAILIQYESHKAGEELTTGRYDVNFLSYGIKIKF